MAFDAKPSTHINGWTEDGTNITVPIASFAELTAAEADATTGDIRKVAFALAEKLYALYVAMSVGDRPAKFVAQRSTSTNDANNTAVRTYVFTFQTDVSAGPTLEVDDE